MIPSAYSDECWSRLASYVEGVLSGDIVTGKFERLAVERFERDVARDDIRFDRDVVDRVFRFFSLLKHYEGEWARQQFVLSDWQCFIVAAMFGLQRKDKRGVWIRLVRIAYIQVARKNGKTTFMAGIALYLLIMDGEPGAQVYSAATKEEQAAIVFKAAKTMVSMCPELQGLLTIQKKVITFDREFASFKALGKDSKTQDGLNVSAAIVDELHAHPDAGIWNVLETATGSRRQPLIPAITTAGTDQETICYEQREYSVNVLEETFDDDGHFAFICELDPDDDFTDPNVYRKANPNIGVSVNLDDLIAQCERARRNPRTLVDFKQKRLNCWVESADAWIPMAIWNDLPDDRPELYGHPCYGGLDLAHILDLNALALVFPPTPKLDMWHTRLWFWMPEDQVMKRTKETRVPFDQWVEEGWIRTTPGNALGQVGYAEIESDIVEIDSLYDIREIGFDPWNANMLVTRLAETHGIDMVQMRQGYGTLSAPSKEFERLAYAGELNHGANPVLRWMVASATVKTDEAGNIKPDRSQRRRNIDGVIATIMGIGRALGDDRDDEAGNVTDGVTWI